MYCQKIIYGQMNIRMYLFAETNEPDNNNFVEVAVVHFNVKDHSVSVVADKGIVKAIKGKSKAKVISDYQRMPSGLRFFILFITMHMYVQITCVECFLYFSFRKSKSKQFPLYTVRIYVIRRDIGGIFLEINTCISLHVTLCFLFCLFPGQSESES